MVCGHGFWSLLAPGIPSILTDLGLETYKEASHTMPYPTNRSPGKRVLVLAGDVRTSVVSGKTHSTVTSLRTGAMALFKDLTICWAGSEHRLVGCVSRATDEHRKCWVGLSLKRYEQRESQQVLACLPSRGGLKEWLTYLRI